jgi:hypothetical protein
MEDSVHVNAARICQLLKGFALSSVSMPDPPIPSESFPGSLYIANAFNLQADWQNTVSLAGILICVTPCNRT